MALRLASGGAQASIEGQELHLADPRQRHPFVDLRLLPLSGRERSTPAAEATASGVAFHGGAAHIRSTIVRTTSRADAGAWPPSVRR